MKLLIIITSIVFLSMFVQETTYGQISNDEKYDSIVKNIEDIKNRLDKIEKQDGIGYELIIAIIAVLGTAATGLFNYFYTKKQKINDSHTEYLYNAKRNLYEKIEPLFFQYFEQAEISLETIKKIAAISKTMGVITRKTDKKFHDDLIIEIIYNLLVPNAIFRLISKQLTTFDLSLDSNILKKYLLAKIIFKTFCSDLELSKSDPKLNGYNPELHADVLEGRESDETLVEITKESERIFDQDIRRQGLDIRCLETMVDRLLYQDNIKKVNIKTFEEFYDEFVKDDKVFYNLYKLLMKFHPYYRPVFWRILLTQARLYQSIISVTRSKNSFDLNNEKKFLEISDIKELDFEWIIQHDEQSYERLKKYDYDDKIKKSIEKTVKKDKIPENNDFENSFMAVEQFLSDKFNEIREQYNTITDFQKQQN